MKLYTIGFTRSSAAHFFGRLIDAGVKRVIDVRLNNTSQLSGFAKMPDLAWFLKSLGNINCRHEPLLAPTRDMLDDYRKRKGAWEDYESRFRALMTERRIEDHLDPASMDGACLLCSEAQPHHCHRRLVAEYLGEKWSEELEIGHL